MKLGLLSIISLVFLGLFINSTMPLGAEGVNLSVTIVDGSGGDSDPDPGSGGGGSGGGGRGGGGGGGATSGDESSSTKVILEGIGYPSRLVTLLKDGQISTQVLAGQDGRFKFTLNDISSGVHTFGVWAQDLKNNKSLTYNFTIKLTADVATNISGIVLPPTISSDKIEVRHGDVVNFVGYSYPGANVVISINSLKEVVKRIKPDVDGFWTLKFNSIEIEKGDHSAYSMAESLDGASIDSAKLYFKVGERNVLAGKVEKLVGDSNSDNKVNLVDFSILAFWYKRTLSPSVQKTVDLNGDNKVNLVDFSIMAYYWTG